MPNTSSAEKQKFPETSPEKREIRTIKKEIEEQVNELNRFFSEMVKRAKEQHEKGEKQIDAIQSDWQGPYKEFQSAFVNNDTQKMDEALKKMTINIGFDRMEKRYFDKNESAIKKYHDRTIEMIDQLKKLVEKLKEFSKQELKQVPLFLQVTEFEQSPSWSKSEQERMKAMERAAEQSRMAEVLNTALYLQSIFQKIEEIEEKEAKSKGEYAPPSDLEKQIEKDVQHLRLQILNELDKLYSAMERGEEVEISLSETAPLSLLKDLDIVEKKEELPPRPGGSIKFDISKISETPTIAPYEQKQKSKKRRSAGG